MGACFYAKRPVDGQLRDEVTELRREQFLDFDAGVVQIGSVLLRRDAVVKLGFDESLPAIEDWDFYVRLLGRHRMLRDGAPVMLMHADAARRLTADRWNLFRGLERLYQKYLPEISRDRRRQATWHGKMALDALKLGYATQPRKHAAAAVRLSPGDPRPWYLMATAEVGNAPRRWLLAGYRGLGSPASSAAYADPAKGLVTRRRALTPLLLLLVATSCTSGDDASIVRRPTLSATQ